MRERIRGDREGEEERKIKRVKKRTKDIGLNL